MSSNILYGYNRFPILMSAYDDNGFDTGFNIKWPLVNAELTCDNPLKYMDTEMKDIFYKNNANIQDLDTKVEKKLIITFEHQTIDYEADKQTINHMELLLIKNLDKINSHLLYVYQDRLLEYFEGQGGFRSRLVPYMPKIEQ